MFWECREFLKPVQRNLLVDIVSDNLCIDFGRGVVVLLDYYIRWGPHIPTLRYIELFPPGA